MKDLVSKRIEHLEVPAVLEAVKERLVENRFNIDNYDIESGEIDGRRNNLDQVISGLYRKVSVTVTRDGNELSVEMRWKGITSAAVLSAFQFFIISLAIFRTFELQGLVLSVLLGTLGIFLNLVAFFALRARIISRIRRDLHDLEIASKDREKE